jgi:hypothetical protein
LADFGVERVDRGDDEGRLALEARTRCISEPVVRKIKIHEEVVSFLLVAHGRNLHAEIAPDAWRHACALRRELYPANAGPSQEIADRRRKTRKTEWSE